MDDTPAIEAVLKADVKRLRLLEEEKTLIAASEKGDDSKSDRLREVSSTNQTCSGVCYVNSPIYRGSNHYNIMQLYSTSFSFQVYEELEAIGAASAEARARRILAVSSLTRWAGSGCVVRILTVSELTRWVEPGVWSEYFR